MIPKIIHQTYLNKKKYINLSNTWKNNNSDWKYFFYNDEDMYEYLQSCINKKEFSNLEQYLENCSKIEKIDIFRYLLMYYIGGIYADIDTNCFKSFDNLCKNEECIFGIESYISHEKKKTLNYKFNYTIGNAILISKQKHPVFKNIINNILSDKYENNIDSKESEYVVQKTGPGIITKTIQNHLESKINNNCNIREFIYMGNKIKILEQIFLYPPTNPSIYNFYPFNMNIYSNHICEGNWKFNKKNNYSTMDFLPYPWIWMYKYKIEYIISILTMYPLINTSIILYQNYKIQSIMVLLSFLSAFIYHTNEYLCHKRIEFFHIIDNIFANNILIVLYFIDKFKNDIYYLNLNTILFMIITFIYHYKFYSNTIMELLYQIPFIFFMKQYFYEYALLSFISVLFFSIGLQEFDYFSSRKYHSIWHLSSSLLIYNIVKSIIV
jgi:mannosyltransferase OCH1-like enzyme